MFHILSSISHILSSMSHILSSMSHILSFGKILDFYSAGMWRALASSLSRI